VSVSAEAVLSNFQGYYKRAANDICKRVFHLSAGKTEHHQDTELYFVDTCLLCRLLRMEGKASKVRRIYSQCRA